MYYVIQRHHSDPKKHYLAYSVPRYLSSEKSQNIIFEFKHEGSIKRKWAAKKEDIVLLTDNYEYFQSVLEKLEHLKHSHLAKIDAQVELNHEIASMLNAMQSEFETIKNHN